MGFVAKYHQYLMTSLSISPVTSKSGLSIDVLNRGMRKIMGWMEANELKLNLDKTEMLPMTKLLKD